MCNCCGEKQEAITLNVEGMSCQHCKAAVERAVSSIDGVSEVKVDLAAKQVNITYDPKKVEKEALAAAISDQGYTVI